jgi:hypothetical protein
MVRPRVAPSGTSASKSWRAPPRQADPLRRSEERTASVRQLFDGSDRLDSNSLQRHRSRARSTDSASTPSAPQEVDSGAAPWCLRSLLIRGGGELDVHVSLVIGGAKGQPRLWRRPEDQPPSGRGSIAPPSRQRIEAE